MEEGEDVPSILQCRSVNVTRNHVTPEAALKVIREIDKDCMIEECVVEGAIHPVWRNPLFHEVHLQSSPTDV